MTHLPGPRSSDFLSSVLLGGVAELGFSPPARREIEPARAIAARLMQCEVAPAEVIAATLDLQPASSLVRREADGVVGVAAILLLNAAGGAALLQGDFDGLAPQRRFLVSGRQTATHCYYWAIAGATKTASAAAMEVFRRVRYELFPGLTHLAAAATPIGRHVGLTRLDLRPARHPDDSLMLGAPLAPAHVA